jgi:hypothetical protein
MVLIAVGLSADELTVITSMGLVSSSPAANDEPAGDPVLTKC